MKLILLLFFVLEAVFMPAHAQTKAQLEEQKKVRQQKIQEANRILEETARNKTVNIGQLTALNEKVANKLDIINGAKKEVALIDDDLRETQQIVVSLENDLADLKKEYANMIYEASKISNAYNKLSFIMSSKDFNSLFRRIKYLQQYTEARKKQVLEIEKTKQFLQEQNQKIASQRKIKLEVVTTIETDNAEIFQLQAEKSSLVRELMGKEAQIKAEIQKEKNSINQLENLISARIKEEIKKNTEEGAKKPTLTPEKENLSNSFAASKNSLPWPVESGFISRKFGKQKHPLFPSIILESPGVYIQTKKGEKIRVVFEGKVDVVSETTSGYFVMVNHGEYFTVYSNLASVNVGVGDNLRRKQPIGIVNTTDAGVSEMLFCVFKNQKNIDPENWLTDK